MEESGVISGYVDLLAGELNFDRSLSRRVRQEVEDHLWEAAAGDLTANPLEAQRRAVAHFGDPHVIAAQFAAVSLTKQARRAGVAAILASACVFAAMKTRIAWYSATQWAITDDLRAVSGVIGLIDRYSFWLSVVIGLAGFAYISSCRFTVPIGPAYRKQFRRVVLLCAAATVALVCSVLCDGALTVLRLFDAELSARALVPLLSMVVEIVGAGVLIAHICSITQRAMWSRLTT